VIAVWLKVASVNMFIMLEWASSCFSVQIILENP